ncbi:MAG: ATP-dependent RecD-like DNA helicase [bacterium]|nr:ATP-dependent RecD-like DNA helicase [bacterium]
MEQQLKEKTLTSERIVGEVRRVIFRNEDNGYQIIKVNIDPVTEVTITLNHLRIYEGITMEFKGEWIDNPKYGKQFKCHEAWEVPPSTKEGLIAFLSSSFFDGIGPVKARRIVNHFKDETYDVINNDVERLLQVRGVSESLMKKIRRSWAKNKEVKDIMIFLQGFNIPATLAVKIYEEYENDCVQQIQQNPYDLIYKVKGVGFKKADAIAKDAGFDLDSELRIDACIIYTLSEASKTGHTYLLFDQIIESCNILINLEDQTKLADRLSALRLLERLYRYKHDGEERFYSRRSWNDENFIAEKLVALNSKQKKLFFDDEALRGLAKDGVILSEEQEEHIKNIINNGVSVLTGGPGTGKSFTTKSLVKALEFIGKSALLCAPTGKAAKRLSEVTGKEAKTIHRTLVWDPVNFGFEHGEDNPLPCDVLIVDETSMVDIHLAASLLRALKKDAQVLFVGDFDQLPPVGPGNFFRDMIDSGKIATYRLTKIFRQGEGSEIITYSHQINKGTVPNIESPIAVPELWKQGAECVFIDSGFGEAGKSQQDYPRWNSLRYGKNVVDMIEHIYAETIPKYYKDSADVQVLIPMKIGTVGTIEMNKRIQQRVNPPKTGVREVQVIDITFREGDKVIQTSNNYDLGVYNGDVGKITEIDTSAGKMSVRFDDKTVAYERVNFIELELAYCVTIHKSQGSEFNHIIMPITMAYYRMLFRNLIYTGITRAKKLAVFIGERRALSAAVSNTNYKIRQTSLKEFLQENRDLFS